MIDIWVWIIKSRDKAKGGGGSAECFNHAINDYMRVRNMQLRLHDATLCVDGHWRAATISYSVFRPNTTTKNIVTENNGRKKHRAFTKGTYRHNNNSLAVVSLI